MLQLTLLVSRVRTTILPETWFRVRRGPGDTSGVLGSGGPGTGPPTRKDHVSRVTPDLQLHLPRLLSPSASVSSLVRRGPEGVDTRDSPPEEGRNFYPPSTRRRCRTCFVFEVVFHPNFIYSLAEHVVLESPSVGPEPVLGQKSTPVTRPSTPTDPTHRLTRPHPRVLSRP